MPRALGVLKAETFWGPQGLEVEGAMEASSAYGGTFWGGLGFRV